MSHARGVWAWRTGAQGRSLTPGGGFSAASVRRARDQRTRPGPRGCWPGRFRASALGLCPVWPCLAAGAGGRCVSEPWVHLPRRLCRLCSRGHPGHARRKRTRALSLWPGWLWARGGRPAVSRCRVLTGDSRHPPGPHGGSAGAPTACGWSATRGPHRLRLVRRACGWLPPLGRRERWCLGHMAGPGCVGGSACCSVGGGGGLAALSHSHSGRHVLGTPSRLPTGVGSVRTVQECSPLWQQPRGRGAG